MQGNRAVVTAVVLIAVLILGWWLFRRSSGGATVDLMSRFAAADKRPSPDMFTVGDVTLAGETKSAIAIAPTAGTRITFRVRVPDDGWLNVYMGLKPEAWTQEGDGVLFKVLVSDGRTSDELFTQHINPFGNPTDRKWIPSLVDLSAYAGEDVDVMFNTYASPPGRVGDLRNDLAVWGSPQIVVR
jgi:hypothetical protein